MSNFYIDFVNGNDANDGLGPYKAAYTSGGTTPIAVGDTVTGGTSGQTAKVVYITVTSGSWAGGDAAGSIYVGTPSGAFSNGEALLVGGSDLATLTANFAVSSWRTINSGPTAARTAPGDNIRIKKHAAPVSLGSSTATKDGNNIVLDAAKWANVSDCESAWTQSANVTQSNDVTYKKQGTYSQQLAIASGFTTGKVAYLDFGAGNEKNLSGYTGLSLWLHTSVDLAGSVLRIDLCSDANGDTPVDSLTITQKLNNDAFSAWNHVLLDKGSALGSSIRSISLVALSDPGTVTIRLDNIVAVNPGVIHHSSMIGLNDEVWNIVAVLDPDGTTIVLHSKWHGATGTPTIYATSDALRTDAGVASSTSCNVINEAGTEAGGKITYQFGWNFSSDKQDGYTNIVGTNEMTGRLIDTNSKGYMGYENIRMANCYNALYSGSAGSGFTDIKNISICRVNPFGEGISGISPFRNVEGIINLCDATAVIPGGRFESVKISADIHINNTTRANEGILVLSRDVEVTGTIYSYNASAHAVWLTGNVSGFINKIVDYESWSSTFYAGSIGLLEVQTLKTSGVPYVIYPASGEYGSGLLRIGNLVYSGSHVPSYAPSGSYSRSFRYAVDSINGDPTLFSGASDGLLWFDHVTAGKDSDWGYGGVGKSIVFAPNSADNEGCYTFYIPAAASKDYKLSFQVITYLHTGVAYDGSMTVSIAGCGITPIFREAVSPTTSWAEHLSSQFTTTRAGMLWVRLEFKNASASNQRFGIDEIKLTEIV